MLLEAQNQTEEDFVMVREIKKTHATNKQNLEVSLSVYLPLQLFLCLSAYIL